MSNCCLPPASCRPIQFCEPENFGLLFPSLVGPMGPPGGPVTFLNNLAELRLLDPSEFPDGYIAYVAGHSTINDGGQGNFQYVGAATGDDNDGTLITPSLGVGRWMRVYSGPRNVKWYGAIGDGVADDREPFEAAVGDGPGIVYLPSGTYLMTDETAIAIPANVSIFGDGKTNSILLVDSVETVTWFTHAGSATIYGVQFKTNQTLNYLSLLLAGTLLKINGSNVRIRDCHFEQSSLDHIFVQINNSFPTNVTVTKCSFVNAVRGCIVYIAGDGVVIEGNQINSPGYFGIDVEGESTNFMGNVTVSGNTIIDARNPIQVAGDQNSGSNYDVSNAVITGNAIRVGPKIVGSIAGFPISVRTKRATVTGNSFYGEVYSQVLQLQHIVLCSVTGNSFEVTTRTNAESILRIVDVRGKISGNSYRVAFDTQFLAFFKLTENSIIWAEDEFLSHQTAMYQLADDVEAGSLLMGMTRLTVKLGGNFEQRFQFLGSGNSLANRALIDIGDLIMDVLGDGTRFDSRTAGTRWLETNSAGKISLLLTALPTVAGAAGTLWNNAGVVNVSP